MPSTPSTGQGQTSGQQSPSGDKKANNKDSDGKDSKNQGDQSSDSDQTNSDSDLAEVGASVARAADAVTRASEALAKAREKIAAKSDANEQGKDEGENQESSETADASDEESQQSSEGDPNYDPFAEPSGGGAAAASCINIEGEDGIQNPIEPPPPSGGIGDILSRLFTTNWYLKFFYLTRASYEQNKFKAQFDMISGAVGNSVVFKYNNNELVQASFLTLNLRLYGGYKFVEKWGSKNKFRYEAFVYGGLRTYFQRLQTEVNATNISLDIHPVWVEPIIGLENQFTWKRWMVALQGDYGSITSRNRQTYQLTAFVNYRMGSLTSIEIYHWTCTDKVNI